MKFSYNVNILLSQIQERLDQFVALAKVSQLPDDSQTPTKFRPLGKLKRKRKREPLKLSMYTRTTNSSDTFSLKSITEYQNIQTF